MSGSKIIPFDQSRRVLRRVFPGKIPLAVLIFAIFDAMMLVGMTTIFLLTRAATGEAWPPTGQPWFPPDQIAINTGALLASGLLVFLSGRARKKREARAAPLLFTAMLLGIFFLFFQAALWIMLASEGLNLTSSQHGIFFCVLAAFYAANLLTALIFLFIIWLRLKPLGDENGEDRGFLDSSTFSAARIFWYFVMAIWPILWLFLY